LGLEINKFGVIVGNIKIRMQVIVKRNGQVGACAADHDRKLL
jgi:hypothetical protein